MACHLPWVGVADGGSPRGSPGGDFAPFFLSLFYRLVRGGSFAAP